MENFQMNIDDYGIVAGAWVLFFTVGGLGAPISRCQIEIVSEIRVARR